MDDGIDALRIRFPEAKKQAALSDKLKKTEHQKEQRILRLVNHLMLAGWLVLVSQMIARSIDRHFYYLHNL
jgi:hypothetical protein